MGNAGRLFPHLRLVRSASMHYKEGQKKETGSLGGKGNASESSTPFPELGAVVRQRRND